MTSRRFPTVGSTLIAAALLVSACGDESSGSASAVPAAATADSAATALPAGAVLVDVRTPDEFAEGHLEGAVSLSVEAADFAARLADLDPAATYVVYCRSGRRSAIAAEQMRAAGFTSVTDLGGYDEAAAATGLPTVD